MAVNRTDLGCLGNGDGSRLAMMDELGRIACDLGTQILRGHLAVGAIDRGEAELGEEFGRAAFVLDHVGLVVAEGDAAGLGATCKADRVGSSSGADKEYGDFTLEDLVEGRLDLPVEISGPIGRRETGCVACQGFGNGRMGAGPIVGREDHEMLRIAVRSGVICGRAIARASRKACKCEISAQASACKRSKLGKRNKVPISSQVSARLLLCGCIRRHNAAGRGLKFVTPSCMGPRILP